MAMTKNSQQLSLLFDWPVARSQKRLGVSLLEVLISITLTMVLLTSIWSLTDTLSRRFESQLRQAETNQMIRSLQQQLSRDFSNLLGNSISDHPSSLSVVSNSEQTSNFQEPTTELTTPANPAWPAVSAPLSAVTALQGTSTGLTMLIFTDPIDLAIDSAVNEPLKSLPSSDSEISVDRISLIRQVRYRGISSQLTDPSADAQDSWEHDLEDFATMNPVPQLIAREESEFHPLRASPLRDPFGEITPSGQITPSGDSLSPAFERGDDWDEEHSMDTWIQQEVIPEIQDYRFSYFDGHQWRSSWNSQLDRGLPQAIRFDFNLQQMKKTSRVPQRNESSLGQEAFNLGLSDNLQDSEERESRSTADLHAMTDFEYSFIFSIGPSKNPDHSMLTPGTGGSNQSQPISTPDRGIPNSYQENQNNLFEK